MLPIFLPENDETKIGLIRILYFYIFFLVLYSYSFTDLIIPKFIDRLWVEVLIDWSIVDNYAIEVVRIITILMNIQTERSYTFMKWKKLIRADTKKL